ncbi:hypothetical protein ACLKA6_002880 [Drosophila palustris]
MSGTRGLGGMELGIESRERWEPESRETERPVDEHAPLKYQKSETEREPPSNLLIFYANAWAVQVVSEAGHGAL